MLVEDTDPLEITENLHQKCNELPHETFYDDSDYSDEKEKQQYENDDDDDEKPLYDPVSLALLIMISLALIASLWLPTALLVLAITALNLTKAIIIYFLSNHPCILFMCGILGLASLTANGLSETTRQRFIECFDLVVNRNESTAEAMKQQQVNKILNNSVKLPFEMIDKHVEQKCSICWTEYQQEDENIYQLNCDKRHIFHLNCITSWFNNGKFTCPLCRHPLDSQLNNN